MYVSSRIDSPAGGWVTWAWRTQRVTCKIVSKCECECRSALGQLGSYPGRSARVSVRVESSASQRWWFFGIHPHCGNEITPNVEVEGYNVSSPLRWNYKDALSCERKSRMEKRSTPGSPRLSLHRNIPSLWLFVNYVYRKYSITKGLDRAYFFLLNKRVLDAVRELISYYLTPEKSRVAVTVLNCLLGWDTHPLFFFYFYFLQYLHPPTITTEPLSKTTR